MAQERDALRTGMTAGQETKRHQAPHGPHSFVTAHAATQGLSAAFLQRKIERRVAARQTSAAPTFRPWEAGEPTTELPAAGPAQEVEPLGAEEGEHAEQDEQGHVAGTEAEQGATTQGQISAPASGKKKPPATEKVEGHLWAKDKDGRDLPPSLQDVRQGSVNDCFLFAAMGAIVDAEPRRIKRLIKDHRNGTYTVTLRGIGIRRAATQTVTADFYKGHHGEVGKRHALWPLVIEKAYMQQKGGPHSLDKGGNPGTAMDDLTNDGAKRFAPGGLHDDALLKKLARAKQKRHPAVALAPREEGASKARRDLADRAELHFWHAYPIVDVNVGHHRVKLFNPWGFEHPNGNGWVSIDDFKTFFIEVDINE